MTHKTVTEIELHAIRKLLHELCTISLKQMTIGYGVAQSKDNVAAIMKEADAAIATLPDSENRASPPWFFRRRK